MVRDGYISDDVAAFYLDAPLALPRRSTTDKQSAAYLTLVRREVRRLYGSEAPFELGLQVHTPLDRHIQAIAEQAVQDAVLAHFERQGPEEDGEGPWAEGAAIVVENATGRVLAVTGGVDVKLEGFIRAAQAERQPGSSFKPYVYATALREGRSQLDIVTDAPISLPAGGGKIWAPKNYGGGFAGSMPMRLAMAKSLNTVAVRLVLEVGPADVAALAAKMGVSTPLRTDPTMALGSSEVTPMDQAMGYATFARGGVNPDPVFIDRLVDVHGREVKVGEKLHTDQPARLPGGPGRRALSAGVAYETADMLRAVVKQGTARRAYVEGMDRAGKTGTTNDCVDAWFVGFNPRYTVAVWIGTNTQRTLGDRETGGKTALPAWVTIINALGETPGERREAPPEVVYAPFNGEWVALVRGGGKRDAPAAPLPAFGNARFGS
jgi:penicillin-binding protein 1A